MGDFQRRIISILQLNYKVVDTSLQLLPSEEFLAPSIRYISTSQKLIKDPKLSNFLYSYPSSFTYRHIPLYSHFLELG